MKFDAAVFDLDGTISKSGEGIVNSAKYAIEQLGFPLPSQEALESFVGPPLHDSFVNVCGMSDDMAIRAREIYRQRHNTIGWKEASIYTGVHELLRSLKTCGVHVALASSKPRDLCIKTLEYFGILPFFDAVCAPDEKHLRDPKAAFIRNALPENYTNACMIGDRKFDMQGACEAGVYPIGVSYGYGSTEELLSSGAKTVCESVEALRRELLGDVPKQRGVFITFEGSDGCGKSTQLRLLKNYLESCGLETVATREPGGCPISERIREVLLDVKSMGMTDECEALLFAAARSQHVHDTIEPALRDGKVVLCDRFVDSSIAYQGAGRGLGDWVKQINERAVGTCVPDLTLIFDLDPAEALRRRYNATQADRIELAKEELQTRVYNAFKGMIESGDQRFNRIDAGGSIEQIELRVRQTVNRKLSFIPEGENQ